MKAPILTLAMAMTSMTAFAQEATIFTDEFVSTKTRAEVHAEVLAAKDAGERLLWGAARPLPKPRTSSLTRDEVKVGVLDSIDNGMRLKFGEANARRINQQLAK